MTFQAGTVLYKSANTKHYEQGKEFETSHYNYGIAVTNRTACEITEFDLFMQTSIATGQKLGDFLYAALPRVGFGFEGQRYGAAFREHFIEHVRSKVKPMAPRRREAVFAGLERSHVEKYRERAKPARSVLVTLEVIRCDASFTGDMAVLDQFEVFEHDYYEAFDIVKRYWDGERTNDSCLELLVQGCFKWGPPCSTAVDNG